MPHGLLVTKAYIWNPISDFVEAGIYPHDITVLINYHPIRLITARQTTPLRWPRHLAQLTLLVVENNASTPTITIINSVCGKKIKRYVRTTEVGI